MKRIAMVLMALAMVFAAVPVNVVAEGLDAYDFYRINTMNQEAVPYFNGIFRTCKTCGGTLYLYCTGRPDPIQPTKPIGCTFISHNEAYPCNAVADIYCTDGYCTNCPYVTGVGCAYWFYEVNHKHSETHTFYEGRETYPSCLYLY